MTALSLCRHILMTHHNRSICMMLFILQKKICHGYAGCLSTQSEILNVY